MVRAAVHFSDDGCAVGTWRNVFLTVLTQPGTMPRMKHIRRVLEQHFARFPDGVAAISVLDPSAFSAAPPAEVREDMTRMTREYPSRAAAIVIGGSGFRAAAARTMLASVYLLSRPTYPHRIFDNVPAAARWVVPLATRGAPEPYSATELAAAVDEVREQITPTRG